MKDVVQKDRSPKKVFVLGVYASAVHAEWRDAKGKMLVRALAVASEPEIFWRGDGAEKIIRKIKLPEGVGTLQPAAEQYNGPSGKVLDAMILNPLGLKREDVWLCDLVPQSRMNPGQAKAIETHYSKLVEKGIVEPANLPELEDIDDKRRAAILRELERSGADTIILLGDVPIKQWLKPYAQGWSTLSNFVNKHGYGNSVPVTINGKTYEVLPLVHPRQAGKLGMSSSDWAKIHRKWLGNRV